MPETFALTLSPEEKNCLRAIVRARIDAVLRNTEPSIPSMPAGGVLRETLGAFVTLKQGGNLRGCIGNLVGSGPLIDTVGAMAEAAAFHDSRFPPLAREEFADIGIEISIMGPITRCPDPAAVVIGRHGLIMRQGGRQGLLLPQVPVEWKWDRETFLRQTCRKAGLPLDAWSKPETEIYWFEAVIIEDDAS